tara:strand:- start:623 stop:1417 length:795 start_codon:yes stop_codon:yes gene_type:complete
MRIVPKKSLGQNFLIDQDIINKIINLGGIKENDIIMEIGPGTGNLTEKIVEKNPRELILIEKDFKLSNFLKEKFNTPKIKIINEDVLKFSFEEYKNKKIIIFGNLPYNISSQILIKWIRINDLKNLCKKFILMFQKEMADRMSAKYNTKNYGRLSIYTSWKMNVEKIMDVNPSCFKPIPKVKSSVIILTPKDKIFDIQKPQNLEHITNIFFSNRRKMIKKPLRQLFNNFELISKNLSLDLNLRPQNISQETFFEICKKYEELQK